MLGNGLSVLSVLGLLASGGAGGFIDSVAVHPYLPTNHDAIAVRVCGYFWGALYGVETSASVNGSTIEVEVLTSGNPAYPGQEYWCADAAVGPLSVGDYLVSAHLYVNGAPMGMRQAPLTVAPAQFCWNDASTVTANSDSDSFPAAVVFNDKLFLFWNKTYDGTVAYASYDGAAWTGDTTIADCETRSAIGAVVLDGRLIVVYSKETSHLYFRSTTDGQTWSNEEQLTFGTVYDTYGATATVHDGRAYFFWKRWQNDGYRHIYSMTYDGVSWSTPTHLWTDDYIDTPAGAVSFQGKLYLFYGGGILYRVLDGAWSAEARVSNLPVLVGSEGSSPAALVVDNRLTLFLVSDWSLLYRADFDGDVWSESRVSEAREPEFTLLNLGAALFHDVLQLFWGGIYADRTGEIHWKVLTDSDGDTVADGCDTCPEVSDPDQTDLDGDGSGAACDCDDADARTYPAAEETNDGRDNQCAGDAGHGMIDELSGNAGFLDPGDRSGFCWPPQSGAVEYEAKRSDCANLCSPCESFVTAGTCWHDAASPDAQRAFFYLVRATLPNAGSWGRGSSGAERVICP